MSSLLYRYATPFTTGLFLVSLVSGLALFFHVGPSGFHGMHEILSLVLILPFGLHIWRNWRPMVSYLKRGPMALALGASVIAAGLFLIPSGEGAAGGPPAFRFASAVMAQPLPPSEREKVFEPADFLTFGLLGWFYLEVLPGWLGLDSTGLDVSIAQIAGKIARLERQEPITGVVDVARGY